MRAGILLAMALAFVAGCAVTFMILRLQPPLAPAPLGRIAARPDYALDGYCPVTLVELMRWTPGEMTHVVQHDGQTFLLASAANKERFLSDPERYTPRNRGNDIVAQRHSGEKLRGKRQHGVVHRERIYLFASEASLEEFSRTPERFVEDHKSLVQPANYVEAVRNN